LDPDSIGSVDPDSESGSDPIRIPFFQFLVIKALDPDWIRIGIQPKMLDPDPEEMNADPQPCFYLQELLRLVKPLAPDQDCDPHHVTVFLQQFFTDDVMKSKGDSPMLFARLKNAFPGNDSLSYLSRFLLRLGVSGTSDQCFGSGLEQFNQVSGSGSEIRDP
jgi:hypothetical protein